jgi:hypothetical protein
MSLGMSKIPTLKTYLKTYSKTYLKTYVLGHALRHTAKTYLTYQNLHF